ncbi:MAG: putative nucleotidyltransferase substrate binding domain-containing protein [Thiohalospira sp.]
MSETDALQPTLDFLRRHAPFAEMGTAELQRLAAKAKLAFFARGEVITAPEQGPAEFLYIIKQGRVRGETGSDGEAWELVTGESFPIGALLGHRPVRTRHRAVEDTFCFELPRSEFDRLREASPVFGDFCARRLASLLDQALRRGAPASGTPASSPLATALGDLTPTPAVITASTTPLRDALAELEARDAEAIAVTDPDGRPAGLLTLRDIVTRVTLPGRDTATPVGDLVTGDTPALAAEAPAWEAARALAESGRGHLLVTRAGKVTGVLAEGAVVGGDAGLVALARAIADAPDIAALEALQADVHAFIGRLLAQGAGADAITRVVATLNDRLTRAVLHHVLAEHGRPRTPFTWLAFGSEGRGEQTLKTDQDNGILFEPGDGDAEAARAELLPLAEAINQALARVGFPLCPGNIMASNPECCLTAAEWRERFARWIDQGTPQHLLNATVFFDFRPLWGDPEPATALRGWLGEAVAANSRFRRQMAENALRNRPPLGLFGEIKRSAGGDGRPGVDLKVQGLAPFVDAARLLALAHGVEATHTLDRLDAVVAAGALDPDDAAAWRDAYEFIQWLRMEQHRRQAAAGEPLDNRLDPDGLNELHRRILKEAFRQARKLQARLALDYQL